MNILIDVVPDTVEINGEEYEINTDFRISILFELMMSDSSILDRERILLALQLYYPKIPDVEDFKEAVEKILWFYKGGKEDKESTARNKGENTEKKQKDIYSFEYDDEYFFSAFLGQYGIDLQDVEHLHWWKFKAMFAGLKEDTQLSKIMSFRAVTISNDMSDSEKKYYREMKRVYALPDNRSTEEKEADFFNTFGSLF